MFMQSSRKDVIANSAWYTLGNILLRFFSFLLIPLYTSYLFPDQYGEINLALGFSNVVSCLIMCGLQTGIIRFYTDCKGDKLKIAHLFGTVISFVTILSLIIAGLLIITHFLWINVIFSKISFYPIVLLAIFISSAVAIYAVYQEFLKGSHQSNKSVVLSYVYFLLLLGTNLVTVILLRWGAQGVLLSTLMVNVFMIGVMIVDLKKNHMLYIGIKGYILKPILKYSIPLVPHSLSYNISNFFTRVVINAKVSTSMLGLYSLASQFGGIADVVSNSVQSAFQPWLFERMEQVKEGDRHAIAEIRNLTVQLLWIYGFIYLMIGAWTEEAIEIMSERSYFSAWKYVPYLILAVAIKSPLYFYQNFYYYYKNKTKYIFMFTLVGCTVSMFLVWWLTPKYGVYGAITGDIVAVSIRVLLSVFHGKHMIMRIYSIGKIFFINVVTILWLAITVLPSYLGWLHGFWNITYKIAFISTYILLLCMYYRRDLKLIKSR